MNCSKFFVSCSVISSAAFCAYALAENHPADPIISHFGILWPDSEEQPLTDIDSFDFVTLFSSKEVFIVPLKVRNSELTQPNPANTYELTWDGSGIDKIPSVRNGTYLSFLA